jgi:hypothetical protein
MGFGKWDREALKGPSIFNYRQVVRQVIQPADIQPALSAASEGLQHFGTDV